MTQWHNFAFEWTSSGRFGHVADRLQNYQHCGRADESYDVGVEDNYCVRVSGKCLRLDLDLGTA